MNPQTHIPPQDNAPYGLFSLQLLNLFWRRIPGHPLFVMRFRQLPSARYRPAWLNSALVTIGGTLTCLLMTFAPIIALVIGLLIVIGIFCLFLSGTIRGVVLAWEVARGIANEGQDSTRMALFHMMPPGRLGISWLLAARAVRLSRRYRTFSLILALAQITLAALSVLIVIMFSPFFIALNVLIALYIGICGVVWIASNNVQLPILGVLCGMLGSTIGSRVGVSAALALGVYLGISTLCLLMTLMIWSALNSVQWHYASPMLLLVFFFGSLVLNFLVYELVLRLLWHWVCRRMNADGREVLLV